MKSIILTLALLSAPAWAAGDAEMGRAQLWHNQNAEARTTLRAALKKSANDVAALRGLGWAALCEDDAKGALLALRPLFRLAPSQPQTAALWPKFVSLCDQMGRLDLLEGGARDIVASPGAPPELRAGARLVLADAAIHDSKTTQAKTLLDDLAFVRAWRAIGPFDNVARSGFTKTFALESEVNFAKTYKGKDDQAVRWRTLPLVTPDGSCEIGRHLGDESPSVFYAATAVFSPQAQSAVLRFNPTGAAKIWVNGALVLSDDKVHAQQSYVADPVRVPVPLKVGWNSLLLKIADDGPNDAAFTLRFTTTSAVDLPLRADPTQFKFVPLGGIAPPTEMPLIGALRGPQVFDPENAALLAALQRASGEPDAAIQTLRGALAQNATPQSAWLYLELARSFAADGRPEEARAARNRAIALNPRLIPAQLEAMEENRFLPPARVQKLKSLLEINPQSASVMWALADAYAQAGLKSEALNAARLAAGFAPGAESFASLIDRLDGANRKREAEKTLARALKTFPDSETLLRAKAERRAAQDQIPAAIVAYRKLLQDTPQPGYLLALAGLQEKARDMKSAVTTLQNIRALRPQDASAALRLADLLRGRGEKTGGLALYREVVSLDPSQVALREKVQALAGEKSPLDLVPSLGMVPLLATSSGARPAGASSLILLDEARQVVYPDRATLTRYRQIVTVFDAVGVVRYRNFELSLPTASATATIESAKIIAPGGRTREIAQNLGAKSISLPSLAPGDTVDVTYRVEDYQKGGLAQQFWTQWFFGVSGAPVKTSRFVLVTPSDLVFNVRSHGEILHPQTRDLKGKNGVWRVREWRLDNVTPRKSEPLSPAAADTEPWLDISSVGSWKQIADWYRDLAAPRCVPDAAIRAKATDLTRNAGDANEKLHSLYRYVAREVQFQSTPFRLSRYLPTEGKQVMREKFADGKDKAALLCALCSAVGIKARLVLLSEREAGITPFLPSPRFNHAIIVAETANGPLWLDAAEPVLFGDLPTDEQGVPALIIGDGTADLTTTPIMAAERNLSADSHAAQLSAGGKLSGNVELSLAGDWGRSLRQLFENLPQNRRNEALTKIAARLIPNARVTEGTLSGLEDPDRPIQIKIAYTAQNFGSIAGTSLLARLPWQSGNGILPALQNALNRTQAIEQADYRGLYLSTVRLQMPAGYVPQELPAEVKDETPWGRYRFNYKLENGALLATREVLLGALRVEIADASAYAAFLQAIQTESQRQIVLKK